jgi:hypothetical protein
VRHELGKAADQQFEGEGLFEAAALDGEVGRFHLAQGLFSVRGAKGARLADQLA